MAEREGYIYRRPSVSEEEVRALVAGTTRGWAATSTRLWIIQRDTAWQPGAEGRALVDGQELRWRRTGDGRYDLLCLSLSADPPPGFKPLRDDHGWHVESTNGYDPGGSIDNDTPLAATAFLAPSGAVQFVALIPHEGQKG
ncbi:MAG TPA: hypothetical protein VFZ66_13050 [Herpetosiphonaceae bacterium]